MRALYGRVQRLFDEAGATNAVWVVDYSTHAGAATHADVEATWPVHRAGYPNQQYEQARVDAVFFNCFLQAYRAQRARSIQSEASAALGGALCATFTPAEVRADSLLRAAKASALALPGPPLPAQHFFDAKPRIEGLELFALLRKMPKGAALHVHSDSMADLTWLVANATYDPRLWLCGELTGASEVSFLFTEGGPPSAASQCSAGHGWRQVTALRGISGMSPAQFDAGLAWACVWEGGSRTSN